jgi:uncharacterized protein YggE
MSLLRTGGRIRTLRLLVPLALAFFVGGCVKGSGPAASSPDEPEPAITVFGEGRVREAPDIARTTVGVEVTAPSAAEATREAATRMAAVISALKLLGIADRDLQTSAFSIQSERVFPPPSPAGQPPGAPQIRYSASNSVAVTIRDPARTGAVLDAAVSAGANQVWGVSFAHSDEDGLRRRARELAVADARSRAEGLARAAGLTLGAVLSIDEVGVQPFRRSKHRESIAFDEAVEATPIETGEITITDRIQIVFALEPAS